MKQLYPEEEAVLLEQIGVMLILLQDLEGFLSKYLKLCLPGPKGVNVKKLLAEDRRTMSDFVKELSRRAHLDSSFEARLKRLLENRNLFIHRLRFQSWFSTETEQGRDATWKFIGQLQADLSEIFKTIHAAMFKQLPLDRFMTDTEREQLTSSGFMAEMQRNQSVVDTIIRKKAPTSL